MVRISNLATDTILADGDLLPFVDTSEGTTEHVTVQNSRKIPVIYDSNGNESLELATTASAVNHLKTTNAATGEAVQVEATGDDTNVDLVLSAKGTGTVELGSNLTTTATGTRFVNQHTSTSPHSSATVCTLWGPKLSISVDVTLGGTVGDAGSNLTTLDLSAMGIASLEPCSFVGFSDGGNAIAMMRISSTGVISTAGFEGRNLSLAASDIIEASHEIPVTGWV